jgi:hypothetical protein
VLQAEDAAGQPWQTTVRGTGSDNPALAAVWGRGQVRKLEDRYLVDADKQRLEKRIVETSLRFGVLSRFTAFVAVDLAARVNSGGTMRGVVQPVETPDGWAQNVASTVPAPQGPKKIMLARKVLPETAQSDFDLSVRSQNFLKNPDIETLGDLRAPEESVAPTSAPSPGTPAYITPELVGPPSSKDEGEFELELADNDDSLPEDEAEFKLELADNDDSLSEVTADRDLFETDFEVPELEDEDSDEEDEMDEDFSFPARRWATLLALTAGLEKLLKDLLNARVLTPEVERLAKLFQQLHALRAEIDAGADPEGLCERAETQALWQEAQAALRAFLGDAPPNAKESRREDFWK